MLAMNLKANSAVIWLCIMGLMLLAGGCGKKMPWVGTSGPQKLYIDAPRNFAVEFPGDWQRLSEPDSGLLHNADGVVWLNPKGTNQQPPARMAVLIPPDWFDHQEMEANILASLPALDIHQRNTLQVAKARATELLGATPELAFHLVLIGDPSVRFLLVYSAAPQEFDQHRRDFRDMIHSFEILR